MAALLNRARMSTTTTGTGTVTLGSAVTGYASFAESGAANATVYSYCIEDGDDFEIGVGTYTSAGTTFSRDTVTLSKISGTSGTSKIDLSGSAEIFITLRTADLGTAAGKDTGTSGNTVPLLDGANTWSAQQTLSAALNLTSGQIAFPAAQNASADANTLDDYEEGSWTSVITASTGTITTATHLTSSYLKIGKTCIFAVNFSITTNGTGAGTLRVTLPFTVASTAAAHGSNSTDGLGMAGICVATAARADMRKYDGTYPGVDGKTYRVGGMFEV